MAKITYLLGAGASADALPVVNGMGTKMIQLLINLKQKFPLPSQNRSGKLMADVRDLFDKELTQLVAAFGHHQSVDTYAKMLSLQKKHEQFEKLKINLSMYFILAQAMSETDNTFTNLDKRYDSLLAAVLGDYLSPLPKNIRVLSWNYDYQLEMAYARYSETFERNKVEAELQVINKHGEYPPFPPPEMFRVFKLNGTIGFVGAQGKQLNRLANELYFELDEDGVCKLLDLYAHFMESITKEATHSSLSFAWEKERGGGFFELIESDITNTDSLVIIGYSFPFFNRKVDKRLFTAMPNLKAVYIQSLEGDRIAERVNTLNPLLKQHGIPVTVLTNRTQFYVPDEFD